MEPIQAFSRISEELVKKPSVFWNEEKRHRLLLQVEEAIAMLKEPLEQQHLTETHAYAQLAAMKKSISSGNFNEVLFIQSLSNLLDIYLAASPTPEQGQTIRTLEAVVQKAKAETLTYHVSLEQLMKRAKTMDEKAKEKSDLETIKKIGLFYVVENLLRVIVEFTRMSDKEKWTLLKEGVETKANGNIPAYLVLEEEDRNKLCYNIFDEALRNELLRLFYTEEDIIRTNELRPICLALKQLTIDLLRAFQKKGVAQYHGVIYAPFGNDVSIDDVVLKVEKISL